MDLEFTLAAFIGMIKPEFPSKPLGTGSFTNAACLIPLSVGLHACIFASAVPNSGASVVVLCGVVEASNMVHTFDSK